MQTSFRTVETGFGPPTSRQAARTDKVDKHERERAACHVVIAFDNGAHDCQRAKQDQQQKKRGASDPRPAAVAGNPAAHNQKRDTQQKRSETNNFQRR
jgi:hypothetical protein